MAKKPDKPASLLRWQSGSGWRFVAEPLPREQQELELAIARKFIATMNRWLNIDLADPEPGQEPSDVLVRSAKCGDVGLQLAEVVHAETARMRVYREDLRRELVQRLSETVELRSVSVSLVDNAPELGLPRVEHQVGQDLLAGLHHAIQEEAPRLSSVAPGTVRWRHVGYQSRPERFMVVFWPERPISGNCVRLTWTQSLLPGGDRESMILEAIQRKISKHYAGVPREFWLVLYSTEGWLGSPETPDPRIAHLLDDPESPFTGAWITSPLPNENSAMVEYLGPTSRRCR